MHCGMFVNAANRILRGIVLMLQIDLCSALTPARFIQILGENYKVIAVVINDHKILHKVL